MDVFTRVRSIWKKVSLFSVPLLFIAPFPLSALGASLWAEEPSIMADAFSYSVKGKVVDAEGIALVGVVVSEKQTNRANSVLTDSNGEFAITVASAESVLRFSFIGFKAEEVTVNSRSFIEVSMVPSVEVLDDIVVVGFGTQKKINVTGSVTTVKMSEVLGDRPLINAGAALQGAVPGLYISGNHQVGQSKDFQIRGAFTVGVQNSNGTYGSNLSPLVLIDNVAGDINMLNPDDIESISVLKDAASTAIYGARGANGVILVTTKRPNRDSKPVISYNNNFSTQRAVNLPGQTSLQNYFRMYKEAGYGDNYWADGQNISDWLGYLDQYKSNSSSLNTVGDGIYMAADGKAYYLRERDPFAQLVESSFMQTHNLSISGASQKLRYRISAGLASQDGPIVDNKDRFNRQNITAFISADATSWFTQEAEVMYSNSKKTLPGTETSTGLFATGLLSYTPEGIVPAAVTGLGTDYPSNTPLNTIKYGGLPTTITAIPRIFLKSVFKPLKGLEGIIEYTYNKNDVRYDYYTGQQAYTSVQKSVSYFPTVDRYIKSHNFTDYNALNIYASFAKSIRQHDFKLTAGFNRESSYYEGLYASVQQQSVPDVPSLAGGTGTKVMTDSYSEYSLLGGFYRLTYNFGDKYLFEANGRYDGSSKFPKGNRFGFFPSFSAGWNISEENFLKNAHWLTNLKLRGSWGRIGNQNIDPYQFYPSMNVQTWSSSATNWLNNGQQVTIIDSPDLVSANFTWETVKSGNIGLDFSTLGSRLNGTFEVYNRQTIGMLTFGATLPAVVGADAPMQNAADMEVRGWELSLGWRDHIGSARYWINANLSDYTSTIIKYNNSSKLLSNYYSGQKLGEIWGYVADGFYTADDFASTTTWQLNEGVTGIQGYSSVLRPGDLKFRNLNDYDGTDNMITSGVNTASDPGDRKIIGNSSPRYQFGASLGGSYKGFSLSAVLQGIGKRDYWLGSTAYFPFSGNDIYAAVFQNQLDYWKPVDAGNGNYAAENSNAYLPRIYDMNGSSAPSSNTRVSDRYLSSAAYMRIKNVTLSYAFAPSAIRRLHLSGLQFFISIENLATFSSLPRGYDPETLSWTYPAYRTTSMGFSLTL